MSPAGEWASVWPAGEALSSAPADRARLALLDDATRSNAEIALAVRVKAATVKRVRRSLQDLGVIAVTRVPRRRFPEYVPRPHQPAVLARGSCVGHAQPDLWHSSDEADRNVARSICMCCPVQRACLDHALTALPSHDTSITGGTTATQRARLRRERGIALPQRGDLPVKLVCGVCDLPLSGANLYTERLADGRTRRRCVACRTRAGQRWAARQASA